MGKKTNPRCKPSAPRTIRSAEEQPAEVSTEEERAEARAEKRRLEFQGVTVHLDPRTKRITGASRVDGFALLLSRRALSQDAHDAFRAHEKDVHTAAGWETPERRPDHIRATTEGAPGQNVTQQMIDAGKLVAKTLDYLSPPDAALLSALMEPTAMSFGRWRHVVERMTGETRDECQAARVRAVGENLIHARKRAQNDLRDPANDYERPEPEPRRPTWFRGERHGT